MTTTNNTPHEHPRGPHAERGQRHSGHRGFDPNYGFTGNPFSRADFGAFWIGGGIRPRRPRGDIRLGILALLNNGLTLNGYNLMKSFSENTQGTWKPGAGSIYPTLTKLVEEGYIKENGKDGYVITEEGKTYLNEKVEDIKNIFKTPPVEEETQIQTSFTKLMGAIHQFRNVATPEQETQLANKFDQLRKDIYKLLSE